MLAWPSVVVVMRERRKGAEGRGRRVERRVRKGGRVVAKEVGVIVGIVGDKARTGCCSGGDGNKEPQQVSRARE